MCNLEILLAQRIIFKNLIYELSNFELMLFLYLYLYQLEILFT